MSEMLECVKAKMDLLTKEDSNLTKRQRLSKAFGICKQKNDFTEKKPLYQMFHDFIEDVIRLDVGPPGLVDDETGLNFQGVSTESIHELASTGSKVVTNIGAFGNNVLATFQGSPGIYTYQLDSEKEAEQVYNQWSGAGSKGKWLFKHIRGTQLGPSYRRGVPTIGGTSASLIPYEIDKIPGPKAGEFTSMEKVLASMLKYGSNVGKDKLLSKGKPISVDVPTEEKKMSKIARFVSGVKGILEKTRSWFGRKKQKKLQAQNIKKAVL